MLFGSNQVMIVEAEHALSQDVVLFSRFFIATLCCLPALTRGLRDPILRKQGGLLGVILTLGFVLQAYGLEETTAARSAVTGTFTVFTVPMLSLLLDKVPVRPVVWASCAMATVGVALLVGNDGAGTLGMGDMLCVLSAVLFGAHMYVAGQCSGSIQTAVDLEMKERKEISPSISESALRETKARDMVAVQLGTASVMTGLLALPQAVTLGPGRVMELVNEIASQPDQWEAVVFPVLFMGVITTSLTLSLEMMAMAEVSAPLAALIYSVEPLWGAGFAWMVLGERWGGLGWIGAAMIVLAAGGAQVLSHASDSEDHRDGGSGGGGIVEWMTEPELVVVKDQEKELVRGR